MKDICWETSKMTKHVHKKIQMQNEDHLLRLWTFMR